MGWDIPCFGKHGKCIFACITEGERKEHKKHGKWHSELTEGSSEATRNGMKSMSFYVLWDVSWKLSMNLACRYCQHMRATEGKRKENGRNSELSMIAFQVSFQVTRKECHLTCITEAKRKENGRRTEGK